MCPSFLSTDDRRSVLDMDAQSVEGRFLVHFKSFIDDIALVWESTTQQLLSLSVETLHVTGISELSCLRTTSQPNDSSVRPGGAPATPVLECVYKR